ncbi:hypothetical protein BP5796_03039 [Coleophoma crateriformis]|uniref:Uncharacterized protein n=1 Tax=Coleophoma crateriformis TaxID=565419 RepID=A0A3D8SLZ6_9HELO|nr:hypothetical protein BP5796_03039 [Coleophoma crateriformis]
MNPTPTDQERRARRDRKNASWWQHKAENMDGQARKSSGYELCLLRAGPAIMGMWQRARSERAQSEAAADRVGLPAEAAPPRPDQHFSSSPKWASKGLPSPVPPAAAPHKATPCETGVFTSPTPNGALLTGGISIPSMTPRRHLTQDPATPVPPTNAFALIDSPAVLPCEIEPWAAHPEDEMGFSEHSGRRAHQVDFGLLLPEWPNCVGREAAAMDNSGGFGTGRNV